MASPLAERSGINSGLGDIDQIIESGEAAYAPIASFEEEVAILMDELELSMPETQPILEALRDSIDSGELTLTRTAIEEKKAKDGKPPVEGKPERTFTYTVRNDRIIEMITIKIPQASSTLDMSISVGEHKPANPNATVELVRNLPRLADNTKFNPGFHVSIHFANTAAALSGVTALTYLRENFLPGPNFQPRPSSATAK